MQFRYLVCAGDSRVIKGVQVASSSDMADKMLASQGYKVLSLKPTVTFLSGKERLSRMLHKVSLENTVTFSRQFALLHESGQDIISSLELLRTHTTNRRFKEVIEDIISDLNKGVRLNEAMAKHPDVFSPIYIQSIKIGEQTGSLELSLKQMADYLEREARSSKSLRNALRYPIIVGIVAVCVITVMAVFVVPSFVNLYKAFNVELPLATRILISGVGLVSKYGLYGLAFAAILGVLFYLWSRTAEGKIKWASASLKMPVLGHINHLNELICLCRSMSILYSSGLSVPDVLILSEDCVRNPIFKQALASVHQDVMKGEGLARPMGQNEVFPEMMVQMVQVGENSGRLDKTLTATADAYETEAEDRMRTFLGLIQPAITIVMGVIVALIAFSMVSAMYSIYGQMV